MIHQTNAWNPTGVNLTRLPGTHLYFAYVSRLNGPRTLVLLGTQRHLTVVADLPGELPPQEIRPSLLQECGLYPHLIDVDPAPGLPRLLGDAAE